MSRTYRKLPHFVTKESLRKNFDEGFYRIFHCNMTFQNAEHYAKAAMAKERTDSGVFHDNGLSDVMGITVNGKPLGYREWSHSRWVKRYTNKVRRGADKAVISEGIEEMLEAHQAAIEEIDDEMFEFEFTHEQHYMDYLDSLSDDIDYDYGYHPSMDDFDEEPYDPWDKYDDWY